MQVNRKAIVGRGVSLIVGLCAILYLAPQRVIAMPPASYAFGKLVQALERNDIALGHPIPQQTRMGRPVAQVVRVDEKNREFVLLLYAHDESVLLLYLCDMNAFVAPHVQGKQESKERWYFCDATC